MEPRAHSRQRSSNAVDITGFPVMPEQCASCSFKALPNGKLRDQELVASIQQRSLTQASQLCHHPRMHDQEETTLCRGARDYQPEMFSRMGFIPEATDEAWESFIAPRSSHEEADSHLS